MLWLKRSLKILKRLLKIDSVIKGHAELDTGSHEILKQVQGDREIKNLIIE